MGDWHEKIKFLFSEVYKKSPQERIKYLDRACGDDVDLREEVEALLEAFDESGDFLEVPPVASEVGATQNELPLIESLGPIIGCYKLLEKIGEGGMAEVYRAQQEKPLRRQVALKIIKPGMDTQQVIARFEAERQALSIMDHPSIAKVFDAGTTEMGHPYFVMELVAGTSITEYCDQNNLSTEDRLRLFILVCNAVQHAHQKGIIHRDIKPSNVMVTLQDGKPFPKVIDFGIAKATGQRLTEKTLFTRYAQMIGTPEYMSPEQAGMSGLDIDTRTDIYSLGVLLYELLTGVTPFEAKTLREAGYGEIQRIIREEEPPKPSTRLSALGNALTDIAKHHHVQPDQLCKIVQGDLDWVVMKSLEKDRTRRYTTANELANDIERHLGDRPVSAGPPTVRYRLHKFICRHRVGVIAGLFFVVVVLVAVVGLSISTVVIWRQKTRTQEALERELLAVQQARQAQTQKEVARQQADEERAEAIRQRDTARRNLYVANMRLAPQYWESGQIIRLKEMLDDCLPMGGKTDLRGWEWYYMLALCHKDQLTLRDQSPSVCSISWGPEGRQLATVNLNQEVEIWDIAMEKRLRTLRDPTAGLSTAVWSPDGHKIATASGSTDIKIWDPCTGDELQVLHGRSGENTSIAWSPDSTRLASPGNNVAKVWDVTTGKEIFTSSGHDDELSIVAWSPNGQYLACGETGGLVSIWGGSLGIRIASWRARETDLYALAWNADGTQVVTGGFGANIDIWNVLSGDKVSSLPNAAVVKCLSWSPDGKYLASVGGQKVSVWDPKTGQETMAFRGHTGDVSCVTWSPDGTRIASAGDRTVKVWNTRLDYRALTLDHPNVFGAVWDPKGNRLATANGRGGVIQLWNPQTGEQLRSWEMGSEDGGRIVWSSDGKWIASGYWHEEEGPVKIWNAETGQIVADAGMGSRTDWSPDSKMLAIASGGTARIWEMATGRTIRILTGHQAKVWVVTWSPDGQQCATAAWDGLVKTWDVNTGRELLTLMGHATGRWIASISWSPDGQFLASGGWDRMVKVWDLQKGRERFSLLGHTAYITDTAWSPDGKRLVSGSMDSTIKIWDPDTGQELATLQGHTDRVNSVTWSRDGQCLATTGNGVVKVWSAYEGYQQRVYQYCLKARELAASYKYDDALQTLARAIELDPDFAMAYRERGRVYASLKQYDLSLSDFAQTVAYEPNDASAWSWLGITYGHLDQWHEMVEACSRAVDLAPGEPIVWINRCCALMQLGEWEKAVSDASKSIELKPDEFDYWARRGICEVHLGRLTDAVADLSRAITYKPGSCKAWGWRGFAFSQLGRWDRAGGDFREAQALAKEDSESRVFFSYLEALARLSAGDMAGYQRICTDLVVRCGEADNPNSAHWITWSSVLSPNAVADFQAVVRLAEKADASDYRDTMLPRRGIVLYREGRYTDAISILAEAVKESTVGKGVSQFICPVYSRFFLAMAQHQLGHAKEAQACFDDAVKYMKEELGQGTSSMQAMLTARLIHAEAVATLGVQVETPDEVTPLLIGEQIRSVQIRIGGRPEEARGTHVVDGSGMTEVDGVPEHSADPKDMWLGEGDHPENGIEFELGREHNIGCVYVWNFNEPGRTILGLSRADISVWAEGAGWRKIRDDFEFAQAPGKWGYRDPAIINLGGVCGQKIRFSDLVSFEGGDLIGLSEVQIFAQWDARALNPQPPDGGCSGQAPDIRLNWVPGVNAIRHDVYLGTEPDQMVLLQRVEGANSIMAPRLERSRWYCWRVDTIKSDSLRIQGNVWTFSAGGAIVAWWRFDEAERNLALDSSGNQFHATFIGDAHITLDPQRGHVLSLDGAGDWVDCGDDRRFDLTGAVTISAWIKPREFTKTFQTIISKGDRAWRLARNRSTENAQFGRGRGPQVEIVRGSVTVNDCKWHHVAGVCDGKEMFLYVDAILDNSMSASSVVQISDHPVLIGENFEKPGREWSGLIDDVRIYSYALSEEEIKELYAGRGPGPIPKPEWLVNMNADQPEESISENETGVGTETNSSNKF